LAICEIYFQGIYRLQSLPLLAQGLGHSYSQDIRILQLNSKVQCCGPKEPTSEERFMLENELALATLRPRLRSTKRFL